MNVTVPVAPVGGVNERTLAVIELLALADEPMRLSDIASQIGIPKSAAHRTLTSLLDAGWVEQNPGNDCYSLTLQLAILGQRLLANRSLTDLKQPILDQLANRTRELVRLTAVQNGSLVWIGSARGRRAGLVYEPDMGEKILPYATANGKVWLASLPRQHAIRNRARPRTWRCKTRRSETHRTVAQSRGRTRSYCRTRFWPRARRG